MQKYIVGSTSGDKDSGMGEDIQWIIECKAMRCPICQKEFSLRGTIGEYPIGAVEFADIKASPISENDVDENNNN